MVCGHCLVTLSLATNKTLKCLSLLPILMQESFWWWQCSDRYIISLSPHLHTPFPPFSLSLISHTVSADIKHHVYLLSLFRHLMTSNARYRDSVLAICVENEWLGLNLAWWSEESCVSQKVWFSGWKEKSCVSQKVWFSGWNEESCFTNGVIFSMKWGKLCFTNGVSFRMKWEKLCFTNGVIFRMQWGKLCFANGVIFRGGTGGP